MRPNLLLSLIVGVLLLFLLAPSAWAAPCPTCPGANCQLVAPAPPVMEASLLDLWRKPAPKPSKPGPDAKPSTPDVCTPACCTAAEDTVVKQLPRRRLGWRVAGVCQAGGRGIRGVARAATAPVRLLFHRRR